MSVASDTARVAATLDQCRGWRTAWKIPDRRPIHEWARDNVSLVGDYAIKGRFIASRWMIPIFNDWQNPFIRKIHVRKAPRIGGTLIPDVALCWLICNETGPLQWTMQTAEMMEKHLKSRIWPLLTRGCPAAAALLPPPGPGRRLNELYLGDRSFIFNAANLNSQQSAGCRWKVNDEIWLPVWQEIYGQAVTRVQDYFALGLSKIYNSSQAGNTGDVEDKSFLEGNQNRLHLECPSCKKASPIFFDMSADEFKAALNGRARAGVVWNRDAHRADKYINVARAIETCRYECVHCGEGMTEGPKFRRVIADTQHYIPQSTTNAPNTTSYHVEALPYLQMEELVKLHCEAYNTARKGFIQDAVDFKQKQRAIPHSESTERVNMRATQAEDKYFIAQFANGELWPGEEARALTVDVQKDHFWAEARAHKTSGDSRQLFFGRLDTVEAVAEVMLRLKIKPHHVFIDMKYDRSTVLNYCIRFGWRPVHGEAKNTYAHFNPVTKEATKKLYSPAQSILHSGKRIIAFAFSADDYKDNLAELLSGRSAAKWELPQDVSQAYIEHNENEEKKQTSRSVWMWVRIGQKPNHGKDCSVMQLVFMDTMGFYSPILAPAEQKPAA